MAIKSQLNEKNSIELKWSLNSISNKHAEAFKVESVYWKLGLATSLIFTLDLPPGRSGSATSHWRLRADFLSDGTSNPRVRISDFAWQFLKWTIPLSCPSSKRPHDLGCKYKVVEWPIPLWQLLLYRIVLLRTWGIELLSCVHQVERPIKPIAAF